MTTVDSPASDPARRRVAIITGGSGGIGRECATTLARAGFNIALTYSSNPESAEEAATAVREAGARCLTAQLDVADEIAAGAMFDRVEAEFGGLDSVVHTAGRMPLSPLVDLDMKELDELHRTNIRGTFVIDQQAARRLRPGGSIINFSTSVVGLSFPTYGAYVASKGAVEALTLVLARELAGRDVTVNAVAPGPVATALFLNGKTQEQIDASASSVPLHRLGQPEDVAPVVAFLASPEGHWVNGQVLRINGGAIY